MRRLRYQKLVKSTFHQLRAECLADEMGELISGNGLPRFTITEIPSRDRTKLENENRRGQIETYLLTT